MNNTASRILKISLKTFAIIVTVLLLLIGIVFYFILTPERLKPIVSDIAAEMIEGELYFDKVELTLFSTFPNVGAELSGGFLRNTSGNKEYANDTIVSFDKALVMLDVLDLLSDKITINRVELIKPKIYAYVGIDNKANWDVLKIPMDTTTNSSPEDTSSMRIALKSVNIVDAKMRYENKPLKLQAWLKSLDFTLEGKTKGDSKLTSTFDAKDIVYNQNGHQIADNLNFSYDCVAHVHSDINQLEIEQFDAVFGAIPFSITGMWDNDSIDVKAKILPVKISELYKYVPTTLISNKDNIEPKGIFALNAKIKGSYVDKILPPAIAQITLKDAGVKFTQYQNAHTDTLRCEMTALYDFYDTKKMTLKVDDFKLSALAADIELKGTVIDPLGQMYMDVLTDTRVDFTRLSRIFSIQKGTSYAGTMSFDGKLQANLNNILKQKLTKIKLDGLMKFDTLQIYDTISNIKLRNQYARLDFASTPQGLRINGNVQNLTAIQIGKFIAKLDSANVSLTGSLKNNAIDKTEGTIRYDNLSIRFPKDSIRINSAKSKAKINIAGEMLRGTITSDSLTFFMPKNDALLSRATLKGTVPLKNFGLMKGTVAFKEMKINTPAFPLPISVNSTELDVSKNLIKLSNVDIHIGESNLEISGSAQGLLEFGKGEKLKVRGLVKSNFIDLDEIMFAANNMQIPTFKSDSTAQADTTSVMPILNIPKNIDANLTVALDSMRFMGLNLMKTKGGVQIKNSTLRIRRIITTLDDSKVAAKALYTSNHNKANIALSLDASNIDVLSVRKLVPMLDTIAPLMKSASGYLNFNMVAQSKLENTMTPDLNHIEAAIDFKANTVDIEENETLLSIAKMLMFKNKKQLKIDSIAIYLGVENGAAEFYPFRLKVDRYDLAFGGIQSLIGTMDMNYHLSVLKSPSPIKFGINITGPMSDFNIGIGKTKYKYLREPEYDNYIEPKYIKIRDEISNKLKTSSFKK